MSSNVRNRLLIASKHLSSQGTFFFIPLPVIVLYHVGPFRKIPEKGATILYSTANDPQLQMNPKTASDPQSRPQMIPKEK